MGPLHWRSPVRTSRFALWSISALLALCLPATPVTIHVPDDQPTIQASIDAASYGDTVLVACGTYYEHDIIMKSGVCLMSETGLADCVTIDAQQLGLVMYCEGADASTLIAGFTLVRGLNSSPGGGLRVAYYSSPTIRDCAFRDNTSYSWGGGLSTGGYVFSEITNCVFEGNVAGDGGGLCVSSGSAPTLTDCTFEGNVAVDGGGMNCEDLGEPTLENCAFVNNYADNGGGMSCVNESDATLTGCLFLGNQAAVGGGGVFCGGIYGGSSPMLTSCTFFGNQAGEHGGGLFCDDASSPSLANTIIAFGTAGESVHCADYSSAPSFLCCNIFGNAGGDWVGSIAGWYLTYGNFSADPLFCLENSPDEPFGLHEGSPCLPGNNVCGELVGTFGLACGPVSPVVHASWGVIKAMYQ